MESRILVSFFSWIITLIHYSIAVRFHFFVKEEQEENLVVANLSEKIRLPPSFMPYQMSDLRFRIISDNTALYSLFKFGDGGKRALLQAARIDRDTLCNNHRLCCSNEEQNGGHLLTAELCVISFKILYHPVQQPSNVEYFFVDVEIQDINDNGPVFPFFEHRLVIVESTRPGYSIGLPIAYDMDSSVYANTNYRLLSAHSDSFTIHTDLAQGRNAKPYLTLNTLLDYERGPKEYAKMTIEATDKEKPQLSSVLRLTVMIGDVNDNAPSIEPSVPVTLREDAAVGSIVTRVKATDLDSGENGQLAFSIGTVTTNFPSSASERNQESIHSVFSIDEFSGDIRLLRTLDYESSVRTGYQIPVIVHDRGLAIQLTSTTTVTIKLMDVNDEVPHIKVVDRHGQSPPQLSIPENSGPSQLIAFVTVTDRDAGINGEIHCFLDNPHFRLEELEDTTNVGRQNKKEFKIISTFTFDYEVSGEERILLTCQDRGSPPQNSESSLQVEIRDENDNSPEFIASSLHFTIQENQPKATLIAAINVTDADYLATRHYHRLKSSLFSPQIFDCIHLYLEEKCLKYFYFNQHNLYTAVSFDREETAELVCRVVASDCGLPIRNGSVMIYLTIRDENDCDPTFEKDVYRISMKEEQPVNLFVTSFLAIDKDYGENGQIEYRLMDNVGLSRRVFQLEESTGKLITRMVLDRESVKEYEFQVMAIDKGLPQRRSSLARVYVIVEDENDNAPVFIYPTLANYTVHCSLYNPVGHIVVKLSATDKDEGLNAELTYHIRSISLNEQNLFTIDPRSGDITLARSITAADKGPHRIHVLVSDGGIPRLSTDAKITIFINDDEPRPGSSAWGAFLEKEKNGKFRDGSGMGFSNNRRSILLTLFGSERNLILGIILIVITILIIIMLLLLVACFRHKPAASHLPTQEDDYYGGCVERDSPHQEYQSLKPLNQSSMETLEKIKSEDFAKLRTLDSEARLLWPSSPEEASHLMSLSTLPSNANNNAAYTTYTKMRNFDTQRAHLSRLNSLNPNGNAGDFQNNAKTMGTILKSDNYYHELMSYRSASIPMPCLVKEAPTYSEWLGPTSEEDNNYHAGHESDKVPPSTQVNLMKNTNDITHASPGRSQFSVDPNREKNCYTPHNDTVCVRYDPSNRFITPQSLMTSASNTSATVTMAPSRLQGLSSSFV